MYDLLPLLCSRSSAPMLRCTICRRCFGFEVVAKMYDLLPLLWFRSGAPMLRCTICCHALVSKWCPNAKMYDLLRCLNAEMYNLLRLLCSRSGAPMLKCTIYCRCFHLEMVSPISDIRFVVIALALSGAPILRYTICCRCFGFEVVSQCCDARVVAVALVSKWFPQSQKNDLLRLLWPLRGAQC